MPSWNGNGSHVPSSQRPASIAELAERAREGVWDDSRDLKHWLRIAEKYRNEGKRLLEQNDIEGAFVILAKAATLVLEKMPTHRDYQTMLTAAQRNNLTLNGQDILDHLSAIKPKIVDRFDKWLQANPDGLERETAAAANPAPAQQQDNRQPPQVQVQQRQHVSPVRRRDADAWQAHEREQQRIAAEEAALWKQQREEAARRREVDEWDRQQNNVAVTAARRAADPGHHHGSQHTVVVLPSDPARPHYPLDESRRREDDNHRRRVEGKRSQDHESIAQRQYAADTAALALRQGIPTAVTPAGVPVGPMFPQATPSSIQYPSFATPSHSASIASPTPYVPPSYPTTPVNSGRPMGPGRMPLESPRPYESDSGTDSGSRHDFRHMNKPRVHVPYSRAPIPSSYAVPVTTTSPPPTNIDYPRLMTPHQQRQGYYPSLNSMFAQEQHPSMMDSSVLFGSSGNLYPQEALPHHSRPQPPFVPPPPPPPPPNLYNRPPPAPPPASSSAPSKPPERISRADSRTDTEPPSLKQVSLPREVLPRFLAIAKVNTENNRETCGLLLGKDKGHKFVVTTLLIPRQRSTSDTCSMEDEHLVLEFTEERSLITLGWIHTHPSQSCFMSSVDLHTHAGFQRMLPESFAVVCAPKSNPPFGIFRLTDPPGLETILGCTEKAAFHPHPDQPIYTDADRGHVQMKDSALEIVDLR